MSLLAAQDLRVVLQDAQRSSPLAGPVSLELHAGDRLGVRGPSGSGKSTLLRCLALLEARAQGTISLRGSTISGVLVPGFRREVMYLPQTPPRFGLSVEASLIAAWQFRSSTGRPEFSRPRTLELFERLRLAATLLTSPLAELSGGELARVALVRALLIGPSILLLDEPTSALDADARTRVAAVLEDWLGQGERAAVIVNHDDDTLAALETRHVDLHEGRINIKEPSP